MNPLRISLVAVLLSCGLLTALLVNNQMRISPAPHNDIVLAGEKAQQLAAQMEENLIFLKKAIDELSFNQYWRSNPATEWPFWLNTQKTLYQAAGISVLGVHAVSTDILSFEKQSLPGKFMELTKPLERLYKNQKPVSLLQEFRGAPAIVYLTPIGGADNNIIGSLVAIQYLDEKLLGQYQQLTQVPVAVVNEGNIKSMSPGLTSDLSGLSAVEVSWPQSINSALWQINLLIQPQNNSSLMALYLGVGVLLTLILLIIIWKQFVAVEGNIKRLTQSFDSSLSIPEQITQLTNLQNVSLDPELVKAIQAIRIRLEQSVQQQKSLNIEIRKYQETAQQLKKTANSLSSERDDAIAAPRLKSEFLSRMGDEITTPMKSVVSMLKLLSEYQLDAEAKQILNIAKRSTRTLVDNLNNILDFSKLDANMLRLKPSQFSVRELIDDLSSELSHYANEKELSLQTSCDSEMPSEVKADKNRIRQILRNLLGNAIRFTKTGEVSLYADIIRHEGQQLLRFTVKDTGVGIPQEAQAELFDSLEQTTKLTNSSFAGRLRLIVSKNLAELMGGEIGVQSETGKGSEFWFTIALEE